MNSHFGFIVLDKPAGMTSHDCVKRLRKIFGLKRVGHGGTLDPAVTGVLPIALGNATRLLPYLKPSKAYIGTIGLGKTTDTDDLEGKVLLEKVTPLLNTASIDNFLEEFKGQIIQKPPIFSSVHIKGERAYQKARRGEDFDIPSKKVTIYELKLLNWDQLSGQLKIFIKCSSGTYIRSLARDLGEKIGCGGFLSSLRRIEALGFSENQAIDIERITNNDLLKKTIIINPLLALDHLYRVELKNEKDNNYWQTGRKIKLEESEYIKPKEVDQRRKGISEEFVLVCNQSKSIIGIAKLEENLTIKPKVVFNAKG